MKYRPDIDGLRAVAVLSVLAFHVGLFRMTGGFVGVDVFFVISGYLVSAIVFAEIELSRFSIIAFYERRIRRIFPALFGMLVPFTIFAWIYFLPNTFVDYSKSLLASTTFASNLYFWKHSGYFDSPLSNPLLHTWSLARRRAVLHSFSHSVRDTQPGVSPAASGGGRRGLLSVAGDECRAGLLRSSQHLLHDSHASVGTAAGHSPVLGHISPPAVEMGAESRLSGRDGNDCLLGLLLYGDDAVSRT